MQILHFAGAFRGDGISVPREVNFLSRPANPLRIWFWPLSKPEISVEHDHQYCVERAGFQ